ncbi:MAG TPA: phosphohydrolase, partial [Caulobacteraceae bacterium]|nr:phosphohydrolase [Caulobacteraceae bacterium]
MLEAAYAEPHRRYHTRAHIDDCLARLAEVRTLDARQRRILEWAIWWHDAVYDPRRSDNEAASTALARRDLPALGASPDEVAEVERLILLTRGHAVDPHDALGAVLVSIDLSILGAAPADYARYAAQVREEYAHVADHAFRAGRAAVLQAFLAADAIFPDPAFHARFEAQARENLERELAALRSG